MARPRSVVARKEKQWDSLPSFAQAMTGDGTFIGSSIPFSSKRTVLRMLGEYIIGPTTSPTALDACKVAVGICRVSSDAFTAGATAVPDPAGDSDYPWLYWAEHMFRYTSNDPEGGGGVIAQVRQSFDIRSMRKFSPSESLIWCMQYADITGAPPMTMNCAQVRVLLTIH